MTHRVIAIAASLVLFVGCGDDGGTKAIDAAAVFDGLPVVGADARAGADAGAMVDEMTAHAFDEAVEGADTVDGEGALLSLAVEGTEAAKSDRALRDMPTAEEVAMRAAARMAERLMPAGCVSSEIDGTKVTYTLNECTGKRGLRKVTGTLVVEYGVEDDGIHASSTATGLKINDITMDVDAEAIYTKTDTTKTVMVTTTGSATGPLGGTFDREGTYTMTFDGECRTMDGSWTTTFVGPGGVMRTHSTQITSLKRCAGSCPAAGGTIKHTRANGVVITITFDGTATATVTTSNGGSGVKPLECTPAA